MRHFYKMVLQDAKADREAKVYLPGARGEIRVFLKRQKLLMATSIRKSSEIEINCIRT